jgi:uncharacterized membrane protein
VPPSEIREEPQERAFDYARTVAFSDGVFAIAFTLLVLNFTLPHLASGHEGELGSRLLDRGSELQSYIISVAVIGMLWVRHHTIFRGLDTIDARLTIMNLLYLGVVAFLPYPTRVLGAYGDQPAAVAFYAGTSAFVTLVAGGMRVHAQRAGLLSEAGRRHVEQREHWLLVPAVFLVSIPVAYLNTTAAIVSWLVLAIAPRMRGHE